MTSRLKRKLNDLGVDPSSSRANESFCLIGTPLPPLEKSKDTGEFVPLWKQEVRDEKGRRRLHGAFTGGFSAGYFNTVGSKEGWTPSTFVSSRGDRAKQRTTRAEDFMDEEDLADLRDSRKLVDENEEMDLTGGTQAELRLRADAAETEKDAMAATLEETLLPTPKDSAGARVLKKMGWRPGQGIGPRLTWRQRKLQDLQVSVGHSVTSDHIKLEEDDEEANKHTYPRRDTPLLLVPRKENSHGLGYIPGLSLDDSLGGSKTASTSGPQVASGFGLGALNDADEDDVDIYDSSISSSRNRTAYDEGDHEDHYNVTIGSRNANRKRQSNPRPAPTFTQTFSDGRPVLPGFTLSEKPVTEDQWFPLPDVPPGWKPNPQRVWQELKDEKENVAIKPEASSNFNWKTNLSADQRGGALGEVPIPSKPRSVFDYLSQKDRDRLLNAVPPDRKGMLSTDSTISPPLSTPLAAPEALFSFTYPRIEPAVAKAALLGFKPFKSDPVRQTRYTAYLQSQSQAAGGEQWQLKQNPDQDLEHFQKELEEYAQAAIVFKPLSGAMAGRFTTGTIVDHGYQTGEGLHTPSLEAPKPEPEPSTTVMAEKEVDAKTHAANTGMYGSFTREVTTWIPAKLLCKRFGVKEPEIVESQEDHLSEKPSAKTWEPDAETTEAELIEVATASFAAEASGSVGASKHKRDLANIGLGEDETQGTDILTYERPGKDIFKAIFASDDEDSGDEDVKAEEEQEPLVPPSLDVVSKPEPAKPAVSEPVDISSFKPVFVPRSEREGDTAGVEARKRKKDKEKKKGGKILVSFEVEEDDGSAPPPQRQRVRKKRKSKHINGDEDEGMWVEKAVPDVVQTLRATTDSDAVNQVVDEADGKLKEEGPAKGRKRAVDFL